MDAFIILDASPFFAQEQPTFELPVDSETYQAGLQSTQCSIA